MKSRDVTLDSLTPSCLSHRAPMWCCPSKNLCSSSHTMLNCLLLPSPLFSAAPTDFSDLLFTFHSIIRVVLFDKSAAGHGELLWRAGECIGDCSLAAYSGKKIIKWRMSLVGTCCRVIWWWWFFSIVFGAGDVWFLGDSRSHPKLTAICLVRTDLQRYKKSKQWKSWKLLET